MCECFLYLCMLLSLWSPIQYSCVSWNWRGVYLYDHSTSVDFAVHFHVLVNIAYTASLCSESFISKLQRHKQQQQKHNIFQCAFFFWQAVNVIALPTVSGCMKQSSAIVTTNKLQSQIRCAKLSYPCNLSNDQIRICKFVVQLRWFFFNPLKSTTTENNTKKENHQTTTTAAASIVKESTVKVAQNRVWTIWRKGTFPKLG